MGLLVAWTKLWDAYPDYQTSPNSAAVKADIGGEVTEGWLGVNSCTIRLSRGLNYSGLPVPANHPGLHTVRGGDGKRYAFRVAEMRRYLTFKYGRPDFDRTKKRGDAFDKNTLASLRGIIAFDIHFADATGHLDLWDGHTFSHEPAAAEYWQTATQISLWKTL